MDLFRLRYNFKRTGRKMLALADLLKSKLRAAKSGTIFVVQDGYEIEFLKKVLYDFVFIDISRELSGMLDIPDGGTSSAPDLREEIAAFAGKFFPVFEDELIRLFAIYYDRILSRMPNLEAAVKALIARHRPIAFMYAVGANTVYEELYAVLAERHNIPVYYFQHGGFDSILYNDPYHKYLEYNQRIRKIRVLCSEVEQGLCKEQFKSSEGVALGSMALFNIARKAPRTIRSKKIIYCPTFFSFTL